MEIKTIPHVYKDQKSALKFLWYSVSDILRTIAVSELCIF